MHVGNLCLWLLLLLCNYSSPSEKKIQIYPNLWRKKRLSWQTCMEVCGPVMSLRSLAVDVAEAGGEAVVVRNDDGGIE